MSKKETQTNETVVNTTKKTKKSSEKRECEGTGKTKVRTIKVKCSFCKETYDILHGTYNWRKKKNKNGKTFCSKKCYGQDVAREKRLQVNVELILKLFTKDKLKILQISKKINTPVKVITDILMENNLHIIKKTKNWPTPSKGDIINKLIFLKETVERKNNKNEYKWTMQCQCGNTFTSLKNNIISNHTRGCGCHWLVKGFGESAKHKIFNRYRGQANTRNIDFKLSEEEVIQITSQKCYYCDTEPSNRSLGNGSIRYSASYKYNGIDRIDNNIGYLIENCVPCCKSCNDAKKCLTQKAFFDMVLKIYNKHLK